MRGYSGGEGDQTYQLMKREIGFYHLMINLLYHDQLTIYLIYHLINNMIYDRENLNCEEVEGDGKGDER